MSKSQPPHRTGSGKVSPASRPKMLLMIVLVLSLLMAGGALARWGNARLNNLWAAPPNAGSSAPPAVNPSNFAPTNPSREYVYAGNKLVAIDEAGSSTVPPPNPIDDTEYFVRQHYRDFLNREPDAGGLIFWMNQISSCAGDLQCIEIKRINVSAAFFLSIEFQETGYLVYRFYHAALDRPSGLPRYQEFIPDTQKIGQGVIVGTPGWETQLESNKVAYANEFVARAEFASLYPVSLSPEQFVNTLYSHASLSPGPTERQNAINEFGGAATTGNISARGRAMRLVAENQELKTREFNRAFVLMQYFGYLRRNPYDFPDTDLRGFNFWLNKLNQFNGNFVEAEMVKAFLISAEYRARFGVGASPVSVNSMTAGSNVIVKAGTVTSNFSLITTNGLMTVAPTDPWSYGTPPGGYTFFKNLALNVTATANVSPPITVTFSVAWECNDPAEFATLRVLHREGNNWVDRTVLPPAAPAPDYINRAISARVDSLGAFAIARVNTSGQPPAVSMMKPRRGEVFTAPSSVTIETSASDTDSIISKVEFYQGDTWLGEDTSAPYSFLWNNVAAGSYALRAKATDNTGLSTFSAYTDITVNSPPPATGALNAAPQTIPVCDGSGAGVTTLTWITERATAVEVRVNAPSGNLFASGTSGSSTTGKWVIEGTVFYLQNVSNGLPLAAAHTLATLTMHTSTAGCASNGRVNVALASNGGIATASSSYPGGSYPPGNVVNGDRKGINWGAGTAGGGWHEQPGISPHWLQVDFTNGNGASAARTINEIDVFSVQDQYSAPAEPTETMTFNNYGLIDFDVQYWNGLSWLTVPGGEVRNNNKVWRKVTFASVTTSRIRIWITRTSDGVSRATELEAWGGLVQSGTETVWVEDAIPTGGVPVGDMEWWNWVSASPAPLSGSLAHQSNVRAGVHQHYFYNATAALNVNHGDLLFTYVYLDPGNLPSQIMLQWDDGTWDHRAYWGANLIDQGVDGTASRRYMGPLPAAGQWVRLEVPAKQVGLAGRALTGMAFTLYDGRATWDRAGKSRPTRLNVALADNGGVALASSTYSNSFPVNSINDGDRKGQAWGNGGGWNDATVNGYPDWTQVDFYGSKTISEIHVFTLRDNFATNPADVTETETFTAYGITSFEAQYWNGSGWVTVPGGNITGNNRVWRKITFAEITTSKIRILINNALAGHSRVIEVEAYQTEPPASNQPPAVSAGGPYTAMTATPINFDSAGSTDLDGWITAYQWDFGDGSTATGATAAHAYNAPGTYTVRLTVTDNAGGTNSSTTTAAITAPPFNGATFVSQSVPASMVAGQLYSVSVTMRNTGTTTWSGAGGHMLGTQNPQDNTTWGATALGAGRVGLPSSVAPNYEVTFNFSVTAPATPGTYNFQRRMLQNGVEWFGDLTPNVAVSVTGSQPTASAVYVTTDTSTQGNWKGVYGSDGYYVVGEAAFNPAYAQVAVTGQNQNVWAASTTEARAPQKASDKSDRIAACWYHSNSFTIDLDLTDGRTHQVALYNLDWDGFGQRTQRVDVLDGVSGAVLDTRAVNTFANGQYLVWNLKGRLKIKLVNLGGKGTNAVTSGLFFDTTPVGHWKFDEGSGATSADATGMGSTATLQGATWSAGKIGTGSLGFDGYDDRVTIASNAGLSSVVNNFTVAFWAYPRSAHEIDAQSTSGYGGTSGQRYAFEPRLRGDPNAGAGISIGTNGISVYEHAAGYMPALLVYQTELTGWTHIAVVYENKQPRLYVNGVLAAMGLQSPRANVFLQPQDLGGMAYGYYDGLLDEVRIYNQPLGTAEIQHLALGMPLKHLSLNRPATQSSTYPHALNPVASRAVDGNTNGKFNVGSVTSTNNEGTPWWQVDLETVAPIQNIGIWNRTDCCSTQLSNFYVFVSDVPFAANDLSVQNQPGVSTYPVSGMAGTPTLVPINRTGRYVRVQLSGIGTLSLAEVQVWGAMPKGVVFGDDFNDNSLDSSKWALLSPSSPVTVSEQNQRLEMALQPYTAGYNGVYSIATHDFTSKSVQVEIVQPVSMGGWVEMGFQVWLDDSNYYYMGWGAGSFVMDDRSAGTLNRTVWGFDPVNHRFWRLRHDPAANTVNFEVSANGQTWTVGKSVPVSFALNTVRIRLLDGAWGTGNGSPGVGIFDNLRMEAK